MNSAVSENQPPQAGPAGLSIALLSPAINIVLFSGGSGTQSICDTLIRQPRVALTVLINAYDDGHSTGRIRRYIPGILGPSDVRKNINRLMPQHDMCHRALRTFSGYRLPLDVTDAEANGIIMPLAERRYRSLPSEIRKHFDHLTIGQAERISEWFEQFVRYSATEAQEAGRRFNYFDCALGNILFAGCYLENGRDFNRTVSALSEFYELRGTLLNVTGGENLFLAARKEDGSFLRGEADIVSAQNASMISSLLLIDGEVYLDSIDGQETLDSSELEESLARGVRVPEINPAAAAALTSADVIIYGPGTQHSSLLPSYLTRGVAESISKNRSADKVFVSNIHRDWDLPKEDGAAIVSKFLNCMQRNGETAVERTDLATRYFFQRPSVSSMTGPEYIPFDPAIGDFPLDSVRLRDWEGQEGKHSGGHVVNEIQRIVQARIDVAMRPVRHLVSIIVPVLNEAPTIERALQSLTALNFHEFELSVEIICVDGGSTDGTFELASEAAGVRTFSTLAREGRGAALRLGIEHARGDVIAFFPADLEYKSEDIFRVVLAIVNGEYRAVFGTRNVKCTSFSNRLSHIYGDATSLYLLSKYGGMFLSMATLLLYNRYVTDPLTSLMAFDADTLRSLNLRTNSLGIHTEIIAELCRRDEYILEIPVLLR